MKEQIKQLRKAVNLNQADFGERIGIKQSTITAYECGNRVPMDSTITAICKEYRVNEQWLRTGEGEMFMPRSRSQQLDDFIGEVKRDPDGTARKDLLEALARMKPEFWEQFAAFCDELYNVRERDK